MLGNQAISVDHSGKLSLVNNKFMYTHTHTHTHTGAHNTGTKHFNFDNIRDELQAAGACEGETHFVQISVCKEICKQLLSL